MSGMAPPPQPEFRQFRYCLGYDTTPTTQERRQALMGFPVTLRTV